MKRYKKIMSAGLLAVMLMTSIPFYSVQTAFASESDIIADLASDATAATMTGTTVSASDRVMTETFPFENGVARIQAEDMTVSGSDANTYTRFSEKENVLEFMENKGASASEASGGDYLGFSKAFCKFLVSRPAEGGNQYKRQPVKVYEINGNMPNAQAVLEVPEDGEYYVWARVRLTAWDGGSDTLYAGMDTVPTVSTTIESDGSDHWDTGAWKWVQIRTENLTKGNHCLNIISGKPGIDIDYVIVTNNQQHIPTGIDGDLQADVRPEKFTFDTNGVARIQAEDMKILGDDDTYTYIRASDTAKQIYTDTRAGRTAASGDDYIGFTEKFYKFLQKKPAEGGNQYKKQPAEVYKLNGNQPNAQAVLAIPEEAEYYIWARVRFTGTDGGSGSPHLYAGIDVEPPTASAAVGAIAPGAGQTASDDYKDWDSGAWRWQLLISKKLTAGDHNLNIIAGKPGIDIDYIIVTNNMTHTPEGIDGTIVMERTPLPDTYTKYVEEKPTVGEHPRLFFKESDLETIRANMNIDENAYALEELNSYLERTDLSVTKNEYNAVLLTYIESLAFDYAINGNKNNGLKAKELITSYLNIFSVDKTVQDYARQVGPITLTAAEVLDWCYDLFPKEELFAYTVLVEKQAKQLEFGYEGWADRGSSFSGHATELMYQCHLLAFSVAIYDEYPDIYNYTAGKIYKDFVPVREYWFKSNTHHQGESYGSYRAMSDLWGDAIIYKMSGKHLYTENLSSVLSQWVYSRRPDGTFFRNGDNYNETFNMKGDYWNVTGKANFLIGNLYDNDWAKLAKAEFLKESGDNFFSINEMTITPAKFLILNNPAKDVTNAAQMPLTKYFGSPYGSMIARTGWDLGSGSSDVLADMRIVETWASNHAHADAGSFQLYYKGILASESGVYDSYNSEHDKQYNKQSVAHNTLAIYDPDGKMQHAAEGIVNSGGQRMPGVSWTGEEVKDMSYFEGDEYTYGKVIHQEAGPNINTPEYSFISGDITPAYNIPGEPEYDRATEVKRSMLFMPGGDADYPGTMIVFDKVVSTDADFHKAWLLHMQSEPIVDETNKTITVNSEFGGKMVIDTLLPAKYEIEKLEGFQIGYGEERRNYAPKEQSKFDSTSTELGWGRIEISPQEANKEDYFLNVVTVTDQGTEVVKSTLIGTEADPYYGVRFRDQVAMFCKDAAEQIGAESANFTIPGKGNVTVVYTGLRPGTWIVNGQEIQTTSEGILYFNAKAGAVLLEYKNSETKELDDTKEIEEDIYTIMVGNNYYNPPIPAYEKDGSVMADLNTVAEVQKALISREGDKVTVMKQTVTLEFTIGQKTACLNGEAFEMPAAAEMVKGHIMVPAEIFTQKLGGTATANHKIRMLTLEYGGLLVSAPAGYAKMISATASSSGADADPSFMIDGNEDTKWWTDWNTDLRPEAVFEFDRVHELSGTGIYFNPANDRYFFFKMEYSVDGIHYTEIISDGVGDKGRIRDYQDFQFDEPIQARYIKFIGYGFLAGNQSETLPPFRDDATGNNALVEVRFAVTREDETFAVNEGYAKHGQITDIQLFDKEGVTVTDEVPYNGKAVITVGAQDNYFVSGAVLRDYEMNEIDWRYTVDNDVITITGITSDFIVYPVISERETQPDIPTEEPTEEPTETPSEEPTETPSEEPTETPSEEPTETPSEESAETPSVSPDDEKSSDQNNHGSNPDAEPSSNNAADNTIVISKTPTGKRVPKKSEDTQAVKSQSAELQGEEPQAAESQDAESQTKDPQPTEPQAAEQHTTETQDAETQETVADAEADNQWNLFWLIPIAAAAAVIGIGVFYMMKRKEKQE